VVVPELRLEQAARDTAVFSGRLFLLDQTVLEKVTENYRRIALVNQASADMRELGLHPLDSSHVPMLGNLIAIVEGTVKNLRESIPDALEQLDAALTG
jgi:hypothetical protein